MATFYVSKTGSDVNPGTFRQPKLTIADGMRSLGSGDILYVLAGTYTEGFVFTNTIRTDHSLWMKSPKVIAYPNNTVILTSNITSQSRTLVYYRLQGLHVMQEPINYAGVTLFDIENIRDSAEGKVHALSFSAGGPDYVTTAPSDLTRPTAIITSHADRDEVYGTITIEATITDNVAVASSWLKLDGETVHSEEPEDVCEFTWDTTLSLNGEHTIQVFGKDTSGNIGISPPITIIVNNTPEIEQADPSLLQPSITVTCPWGVEKWGNGIEVDITWTSIGIEGNLDIYLLRDGFPYQIFGNISNSGTVPWTVFGNKAPNCQIQIKSINNLNVIGLSEFFDIV